jgi:hypothetical protein
MFWRREKSVKTYIKYSSWLGCRDALIGEMALQEVRIPILYDIYCLMLLNGAYEYGFDI